LESSECNNNNNNTLESSECNNNNNYYYYYAHIPHRGCDNNIMSKKPASRARRTVVLYVEGFGKKIPADTLSQASGGWTVGGREYETDLAREDIWHESLENIELSSPDASSIGEEALLCAMNLTDALGHATLPASESDTTGRVVLFLDNKYNEGIVSANLCIAALGLKEAPCEGVDLVTESTVSPRDWEDRSTIGFCYDDNDDDDEDGRWGDAADMQKIVSATELMASELMDHFEYNVSEHIVCGPVLYGGRHAGNPNAIIAVLSMRVWT